METDDYSSFSQGGASGSGTGEESYDPMAYYRQQQQEMLQKATQHVQASQEEIQQVLKLGLGDLKQKLWFGLWRVQGGFDFY